MVIKMIVYFIDYTGAERAIERGLFSEMDVILDKTLFLAFMKG